MDTIDRDNFSRLRRPIITSKSIRLGFHDLGHVEISVPLDFVATVKQRMDECVLFHAVTPYKWLYLGYVPICFPGLGLWTFGDVALDETTGVFMADAMTANRLRNLIIEMKHVCMDIPVQSAKLEAQPSYKMKPDKEALESNFNLLKEGWDDIEVTLSVDKVVNKVMGKRCGYCGEREGSKLQKCACGVAFYCGVDCQRKHWKEHKRVCDQMTRNKNDSRK